MLSTLDLAQIERHEISPEIAQRQQNIVQQGKMNVKMVRPALNADGVFPFDADRQIVKDIIINYKERMAGQKIVKFVPSSGAATRMFKDLFVAMEKLIKNANFKDFSDSVVVFFEKLPKFAFFEILKDSLNKENLDIEKLLSDKNYLPILQHLLTEKGLDYGKSPKGLLPFHNYFGKMRTALEEHLVESADYIVDSDNVARLHFTVSAEHLEAFKSHCRQVVPHYEKLFKLTYEIDFSTQNNFTDTLAFTTDNEPFRDKKGNLVFRPGGHGSLIENLNNIDADIVVIKNIDNVTLDIYRSETIDFKRLLVCFLICLQKRVFEYLNMFDTQSYSAENIEKVEIFLQKILFIRLDNAYLELSLQGKQEYLYRFLNRPMRVCGVVLQENEPGGGPFWVKNENKMDSLQIVETSEIDISDPEQVKILENSQYFNPVDVACYLKNYRGEQFNLPDYVDYNRYFISEKSHEGKTLKAIENPGLWNGAMSDWITVFISVPLTTFTPVKTVTDLLRSEHLIEFRKS